MARDGGGRRERWRRSGLGLDGEVLAHGAAEGTLEADPAGAAGSTVGALGLRAEVSVRRVLEASGGPGTEVLVALGDVDLRRAKRDYLLSDE